MTIAQTRFFTRYAASLQAHLNAGSADHFGAAYELGRSARTDGLSAADLAEIHREAVIGLGKVVPLDPEARDRADQFLAEAVAPLQASHRPGPGPAGGYTIPPPDRAPITSENRLRHLARHIIAAQEHERSEISRELHDEILQTLVGINAELSALGLGESGASEATRARIARTQRLVEDSVLTVHEFARGLRPAMLDDLGLVPTLRTCAFQLAGRTGIEIDVAAEGEIDSTPAEIQTALFRVAEEALTNVARHAHASHAHIRLRRLADRVEMEIEDDGQSFDAAGFLSGDAGERIGLATMRERIEMSGGSFGIESAVGHGTVVRASIPVPA